VWIPAGFCKIAQICFFMDFMNKIIPSADGVSSFLKFEIDFFCISECLTHVKNTKEKCVAEMQLVCLNKGFVCQNGKGVEFNELCFESQVF
jgi:hypothetical protein